MVPKIRAAGAAIIVAGIGIALGLAIVRTTLAEALAPREAALALWLNPTLSAAHRAEAARLLRAQGSEEKGQDQVRLQGVSANLAIDLHLSRALARAPASAATAALYATLADQRGDATTAKEWHRRAAALHVHQSESLAWLLAASLREGDYRTAAAHSDSLLRTRSQALEFVAPVLTAMLEDERTAGLVRDLLAANPPWRGSLLTVMSRHVRDARTLLNILTFLRTTSHPPTDREVHRVLNFLVEKGFYSLAHYTWLEFLPPERLARAGFLYNGSFEYDPSGAPFDWQISALSGAIIDVVPAPFDDATRMMMLDLGRSRVDFSVKQRVLLAPGRYRLEGRVVGSLAGRRGLRWRVRCVSSGIIGETDQLFGGRATGDRFFIDFSVPEERCPAQVVSLELDARSPSEQLVVGKLAFGGLKIQAASAERAP